ncbi:exodeoxyribonuclease I [Sodalis-like secondary symbiont of Drepanosiphum platanoidis]|uniref:exodeoxyribonuclease I n=1 Tax=Sodalis-like secondary symbiont of Drepanosiphum platanoidis TaxID=2994493 RepID=UPI00346387DD
MINKKYKSTFLFYDYETFGISPSKDRPVQFASIRTNNKFEIIEKPNILYCYPNTDYLPNLESILITGITPKKAQDFGIIESRFAFKIYNIFNVFNTCIIGFNNIKFDDEFTRYLFYRNLLDPYTWSWKNKNSRWDVLKIMHALYALRPNGIYWPYYYNGFPDFKLHSLAKANNIKIINPHNAIYDVLTTIKIIRLAYIKQPIFFKYLYKIRNKEQIKNLIDIKNMIPLVYVPEIFNKKKIAYLIVPIAWHPKNNNILIIVFLHKKIKNINNLLFNLLNNFFLKNKHKFKNYSYSINFIYINKCPILAPINILRLEDYNRLNIDKKNCLYNLENLKKKYNSIKNLINYFSNKKIIVSYKDKNVDYQLYNNFFNSYDRKMMNKIIITDPKNISLLNIKFYDYRLPELLFKYRARNFPNTLNIKEKSYWINYKKNIFNFKVINNFFKKIKLNINFYKNNKKKLKIIKEVFDYINYLIK